MLFSTSMDYWNKFTFYFRKSSEVKWNRDIQKNAVFLNRTCIYKMWADMRLLLGGKETLTLASVSGFFNFEVQTYWDYKHLNTMQILKKMFTALLILHKRLRISILITSNERSTFWTVMVCIFTAVHTIW